MQDSISSSKMFQKFPKDVQAFIASKRISFAFYKEELDEMFRSVDDANGLRVYLSLNKSGRRTVVIVPCRIRNSSIVIENRLPAPPDDGGNQYPFVVRTSQDAERFDLGNE